jgi:hypothetical protein
MLEVRQLFEQPEPRERMAIGRGLAWSAGEVLRTPAAAWAVLLVITVTAPLYAMNYHLGEHPIAGFWAALVLGAVAAGGAMGVVVASLMGHVSMRLAMVGMAAQLRNILPVSLAIGVTWTAVVLLWREMAALELVPPRIITEYFVNTWSSPWKPLAHVGALAVLHLAAAPFAALSVPAVAAAGTPIGETMAYIRGALHHKMYSAFALGGWLLVMATAALVPWLGLLAVPVTCLLLVRVFHYSFARREDWPAA